MVRKLAHEGSRTIECSTEHGFTRRLAGTVQILFAVSRLSETGRQVTFTRTDGCIVNERHGSKIPMHWKDGVYTSRLCVEGVHHDETMYPKSEKLGTLSGGNGQAGLYVRG